MGRNCRRGRSEKHMQGGVNMWLPGDSKWPFYPLIGGHKHPFKRSRITMPKRSRIESPGATKLIVQSTRFFPQLRRCWQHWRLGEDCRVGFVDQVSGDQRNKPFTTTPNLSWKRQIRSVFWTTLNQLQITKPKTLEDVYIHIIYIHRDLHVYHLVKVWTSWHRPGCREFASLEGAGPLGVTWNAQLEGDDPSVRTKNPKNQHIPNNKLMVGLYEITPVSFKWSLLGWHVAMCFRKVGSRR